MYETQIGQAQNNYGTEASVERPNVRTFLDQAQEGTNYLESLVEQLEDRVNGPGPRQIAPGSKGLSDVPTPYQGLTNHSGFLTKRLDELTGRLNVVLQRL